MALLGAHSLLYRKAMRGKHAAQPCAAMRASPWRATREVESEPAVALLYDAENMSARCYADALDVAHGFGKVRVARAFGPAQLLASSIWTDLALSCGVERVVCEGCAAGKNSADIRLAIDAMDLLADGLIHVFVIASNDTDFAPIARRLRRAGKGVHGVGVGRCNAAYRGAYDSFTALARFRGMPDGVSAPSIEQAIISRSKKSGIDADMLELIVDCALRGAADDGWCTIDKLNRLVRKERCDFTLRRYGCKNMKKLIAKTGLFEMRHESGANYVRLTAA